MKYHTFILAFILLSYSPASLSKVYQWTDANGVTQFSQTPPPNKKNKKRVKVITLKQTKKAITQQNKNKYPLQLNKDGYACNILNIKQFHDERKLLGHLRKYLSSFKNRHIQALKDYKTKSNSNKYTSKSTLDYYKSTSENYKCMTEYSQKTIAKMEPIRLKFVKEFTKAKEDLDRVERSGNRSSNSRYNEYRNKYHKLSTIKHGLVESLEELDGYQ